MISVDLFFTVLFALLVILSFIAALYYTKVLGGSVARTSYDKGNTTSGYEAENFDKQKYIIENLAIYGVCNMGTSLNEREIHCYEYSRIGL